MRKSKLASPVGPGFCGRASRYLLKQAIIISKKFSHFCAFKNGYLASVREFEILRSRLLTIVDSTTPASASASNSFVMQFTYFLLDICLVSKGKLFSENFLV